MKYKIHQLPSLICSISPSCGAKYISVKLLKESVSFPKNDMYVVSLECQLQTRSTFTVSRSSILQHPGGTRQVCTAEQGIVFWVLVRYICQFKTECIRKLTNFNFQWIKTFNQNNLKLIVFFFTFLRTKDVISYL